MNQLQRQLERASSSPTISMCEDIQLPDSSFFLSATSDANNDDSRVDQYCEGQFEDMKNGLVVVTANNASVGKPVNSHGLDGDEEWEEQVKSAAVFEATPKIDLNSNGAQSHQRHVHKVVDDKDGEAAHVWNEVESDDSTYEAKGWPSHHEVMLKSIVT